MSLLCGGNLFSDMAACREPSTFTLKEPPYWGHLKINVHPLPLLCKNQISLRDVQWLFSLYPLVPFPFLAQAFIFCPSYPLWVLFSFLISRSLLPIPSSLLSHLLSSSCPSGPRCWVLANVFPDPPSLCSQLAGSDRRGGQLEFVWHNSFPLCQKLVLLLW